ncbi:PH domain-containing protein, partial [Conexibacter sp. JD483]
VAAGASSSAAGSAAGASPSAAGGATAASQSAAGGAAGANGAAEAFDLDAPPEVEIARLRWRWLPYHLLSPWTLLLPVAAFGALFNLLDQIGLEQRFGRIVGNAAEDGLQRADTEPWWAFVLLVLLALVVLSLVGAVGAGLQFGESWWRFRLTREPSGTLHLSRGLLTSRSVTIEQRRLRGVQLSEPPLQRLVGGAGLRAIVSGLRSSGHDRPEGGADTLLPHVGRAEAEAIAAEVLQEHAPAGGGAMPGDAANSFALVAGLVAHPRAALRRRLTRAVAAAGVPLLALLLAGPVAGWLPSWLWLLPLALAPLFLLLAHDAYRALGHRLTSEYVVTRHGLLSRHTTALRRDGVIGWNVRRSPFQRRSGLVTLTATTAAGKGGYEVVDIAAGDGLAFAEAAVPGLLAPFLEGDATAPAADAEPAPAG